MTTFLALLLAHLLADFPLQTNRIFRLKLAGNIGLTIHVCIHVMMAFLMLNRPFEHLNLLLVLGVAHFVVDWIKIRHPGDPQWPGFILDQFAHLLTIIFLAIWQPGVTVVLPLWIILPLIFLVLLPAFLMLLWVWANDAQHQPRFQQSRSVHWASYRLLTLSQRTGWVAVILLLACRFIVL